MKYIFQLNSLMKLQKSYTAFLPTCPPSKVEALSMEIVKLNLRISKINGMTIEESLNKVTVFYETKQSKANLGARQIAFKQHL